MDNKTTELLNAIRPFISRYMEKRSEEWSDETDVTLQINLGTHGGHVLHVTLKQLRELWRVHRELVTSEEYLNS